MPSVPEPRNSRAHLRRLTWARKSDSQGNHINFRFEEASWLASGRRSATGRATGPAPARWEASLAGHARAGWSQRSGRPATFWDEGGAGHRAAHLRRAARSAAGDAATLELELEFGGPGGQRLLPAGPAAENEAEAVASVRKGRAQSALRWFTTVVLCAAFLGLVRAGPNPPRPRLEQASCREPGLPNALRRA